MAQDAIFKEDRMTLDQSVQKKTGVKGAGILLDAKFRFFGGLGDEMVGRVTGINAGPEGVIILEVSNKHHGRMGKLPVVDILVVSNGKAVLNVKHGDGADPASEEIQMEGKIEFFGY